MTYDRKVYRASQDAIGAPGDPRATDPNDANTLISLSKALLYAFNVTGISVTFSATNKGTGTSPNALRTVEASDSPATTALTSIDGHVDGLETLITSSNTKLDTLHTDLATTIAAYIDGLEALIGTTNSGNTSILAKLSSDPATQTTLAAVLAKLNSSVAVTGTFWQATQPVSIASMPSTPVTGTFWQATQPVSGTVAATQSGTWNVTVNAALPAGTNLLGKVGFDQTTVGTTNAVSLAQIGSTTIASGNGVVSAGVQRVAIASDNTAFSVNAVQSGTWNVATVTNLSQLGGTAIAMGTGVRSAGTQRVTVATDDVVSTSQSGAWTVTANAGSGTLAVSLASVPSHAVTNAGTFAVQSSVADGANTVEGAVADAAVSAGATGSISAKLRAISRDIVANIVLAAGSAIIGKVGIDQTSGQNIVKTIRSATGTQSSVASSATDVTILASNANRLGASVYNDSTAILYLLLANATSSATAHSVQMQAGAYFEVPAQYTGVIKGIWASATGSARVTEMT